VTRCGQILGRRMNEIEVFAETRPRPLPGLKNPDEAVRGAALAEQIAPVLSNRAPFPTRLSISDRLNQGALLARARRPIAKNSTASSHIFAGREM